MICACCGKPKGTIKAVKSALINTSLMVCEDCRLKKFEPRAMIVVVGRSKGIDSVREYIVNHRYVGKEITAVELTP